MNYQEYDKERRATYRKTYFKEYYSKNKEILYKKNRERLLNDPIKMQQTKDYQKEYWLLNKGNCQEKRSDKTLNRLYGIDLEFYNLLFVKQKGLCAICFNKNIRNMKLAVDHDHKTGKIRGLLCHKCNMGIGHFNDDISLIKSSLKYLKKYEK